MTAIQWSVIQAQRVEAAQSGPRMNAGAIDIERMPKGAKISPAGTQTDGAGYYFTAHVRNDGWSAFPIVAKRRYGSPQNAQEWEIELPRFNVLEQRIDPAGIECKADGVAVVLPEGETDLVVLVCVHTTNEGERIMAFLEGKLPGVAAPKAQAAGGYAPGPEPCVLPDKLPYFRPNAPLTRGQLVIMLTRFAVWTVGLVNRLQTLLVQYATGRATAEQLQAQPLASLPGSMARKFQDVPPGSPFYVAAQTANEMGLIGGYPCKEEG